MPDATWDAASGRFRGPTGRFVPERAVRASVDALIDTSRNRVAALTERLRGGQLSLAEWQQGMVSELKALHVTTATVAHGGKAQVSQADYGWTGQRLKVQYGYLRNMAAQIANGQQPLNGRVVARASLYPAAARQTFEEMAHRDKRLRGAIEERWVRRASESCSGCETQSGRGWVAVGQLPPLGSQPCRANCRCHIETRQPRRAAA